MSEDCDPVNKHAEDPKAVINKRNPIEPCADIIGSPKAIELLMSEDTNNESLGDKALNAAKDTVNSAAAHVDEVEQHFKQKLEAVKRPEAYVERLKNLTKAAPLAMLAVGFVGGVLYARRR